MISTLLVAIEIKQSLKLNFCLFHVQIIFGNGEIFVVPKLKEKTGQTEMPQIECGLQDNCQNDLGGDYFFVPLMPPSNPYVLNVNVKPLNVKI